MKALCLAFLLLASTAIAQDRASDDKRRPDAALSRSALSDVRFLLMEHPAVQKEVGLSEKAIEQVNKVFAEKTDAARNRDSSEESLKKGHQDFVNRVKEILTPPQEDRLMEIYLQSAGVRALVYTDIAEKLHFSDEQNTKFNELFAPRGDRSGRYGQGLRGFHLEELYALLTPEQREHFEKMKGKKFDVSQLYPPRESAPNRNETKAAAQWEYKVVDSEDGTSDELKKYGDDGWELVSVIAGTRNNGDFRKQRFYFKRPKSAAGIEPKP